MCKTVSGPEGPGAKNARRVRYPRCVHPHAKVHTPPLGDAARHLAVRTLARQARLFPELDLHAMEEARERSSTKDVLSPLDLALAHAIHDHAVRRWLTLRFLLQACLTQPFDELEARVKGVLLAGAAQIVLLDRVPAHGAINHAVEWAKLVVRPGAGALVNAVLRKLVLLAPEEDRYFPAAPGETHTLPADRLPMSDGSWRRLAGDVLPEDPGDRLSIATSIPRWLLDRWADREGDRVARALALHGLIEPPVILNVAHRATIVPNSVPHDRPGRAVFTGNYTMLHEQLASRHDIWAQDDSSAGAIESLAGLKPRVILDLCAGRGTKTRQLAQLFPDAQIGATDTDDRRLEALRKTFAGHGRVTVAGMRATSRGHVGKADLIVLDVPCSNTGVLARRPEARYRADPTHLASLLDVQRQIIADSLTLLAPGGRILYATCSLEPEENQQQAKWAEKWHKFVPTRERKVRPSGAPGSPATAYTDGAYSVLLEPGQSR